MPIDQETVEKSIPQLVGDFEILQLAHVVPIIDIVCLDFEFYFLCGVSSHDGLFYDPTIGLDGEDFRLDHEIPLSLLVLDLDLLPIERLLLDIPLNRR